MRDYDDDNIQQYAPVLRRIIILIAVIVAVPVVLWTITAFMRTYIAQPVIPSPKPLAVTDAAPPAPVADTSANNGPAATAAVAEARAMAMEARSADLSAKREQLANPSVTSPAPDTATTASVQPAAPVPAAVTAATALAVAARPQAAPPASDVFPNPPAAFAAPQQQTQMPAMPSAAAADAPAADDVLPPPDPITGPVPMPRHRPGVFALVESGVVPLPRARPTAAPELEKSTTDTPTVYDPGLGTR